MSQANPTLADIGVVYRRGQRLLLALGKRLLVGSQDGELSTYRPRRTDRTAKGITVEALCRSWGVEVSKLDALAREHMPRPEPRRRRTRPRVPQAQRDYLWKSIRMHRLRTA